MQLTQPSTAFGGKDKRAERPVVLVIDDHPTILEMLSWALSFQGYQPACATNGQEALELLEKEMPDLIFLDMAMPVMDGREFLARLRDQPKFADLPVALMTVMTEADMVGPDEKLPVQGILLKSRFSLAEVLKLAKKLTGTLSAAT